MTLTCDFDNEAMPRVSMNFSILRLETPEQVASRHHRGQGPFGVSASLQQPVGKIRSLPQLGDGHVGGAASGIEVPVPVTVAGANLFVGTLAIVGPHNTSALTLIKVSRNIASNSGNRSGRAPVSGVFDKPA